MTVVRGGKEESAGGWNRWRKVLGVIYNWKLPARVKGKVYSSVVRPAIMYGLETVAVTKKQVEEMEVAEIKMLRFAMGVMRKDKIRNEYIRGTVKVERLGIKMREGRLRWYGHVMRREQEYCLESCLSLARDSNRIWSVTNLFNSTFFVNFFCASFCLSVF